MRWHDGLPAALSAALVIACGDVVALAQQNPALACGGDEIAHGTVSRVIDARTFMLDDGHEVRLAAIEAPLLPVPQDPGAAPGAAAAKATLDALVGGDTVVLRRAEAPSDRYGRLLGYAYAVRDGEELFAQGELLAAGYARVGDRVGSRACAIELLGRERAARAAKLGLWANSYYDVLAPRP